MPGTPAGTEDRPPRGRGWSGRRIEVRDESMLPGLRPGDRLLIDRRAYRDRLPRVGEVVVLEDPEAPTRWLIKRIAAVGPGPVPALGDPDGSSAAPSYPSVPEGEVFVVSDAPGPTRDSRRFGPVPLARLIGRAYRRYFPVERCGNV